MSKEGNAYGNFASGRREFISRTGLALTGLMLSPALLHSCAPAASLAHIKGGMRGADFSLGHLLRQPGKLPAPTRTERAEVLIIGGGITGLSAKRWLQRSGLSDVVLLELENHVGGNAASGQNAVSAYPWGAHYLPIPDVRNRELLAFLQEANVITGYSADGLPIYNEYHLCHDPEERLYINGHWQQGLVPEFGVPDADRQQIARFLALVEELRHAKGTDGLDAFAIPLDRSSADEQFRQLDAITFAEYLGREGFSSPYLRWFLAYSCRDDYGATPEQVSAWAGLHYFAARKGRAHNAEQADVLTWPEGNGYLVEQLRRQTTQGIRPNTLAYQLRETATGVEVLTYDGTTKQTTRFEARKVLLATPHFVTQRLLAGLADAPQLTPAPHHAPWVIANLTVDGLPQGPGQPLCWDNVLYNSQSVGYISATHQQVTQPIGPQVITLYWPLSHPDANAARREAYQTSYNDWLQRVVAELETAHPGITPRIQHAEVWVWGHGMVAPTPGYLWGSNRQAAAQPLRNKLYFAHTDLSGISIFEEAFYQGIRAATEMLLPA
ncbi:FAD-dependent oxidoreductase [Solirubrum puertoriconensis]|uniref:FAD-dependent oxidoreductase n=1 Tax=Solirubrum puertoriconensis TaxID=1751427 RepID=A0A9X0L5T4_SOLP1|nr:FAD-dependent oxidoreductase [Solirubrum puertoriconensis]KUG08957.1 FAD-dependent oxidoreductase [Solirubrum puertoriconensis]